MPKPDVKLQTDPPGFVTDEGCWEKAKSAAAKAGASDPYAFANYWYQENCASRVASTRYRDAATFGDVNGKPPREFKIWSKGENQTDHGTIVFSDRSAQALMADQAKRGNLYSVDVDHLSLSPTAPPEARKAVGWHRLEVRDGDLWAVDVQWTQVAASALSSTVPEYRYFSPAYDVDTKTGEIVGYVNTALTNNPATWNVTALASAAPVVAPCKCSATLTKEAKTMPKYLDEVRAAVAKMAAEGDEEEMKMAARLMSAFGEAPAEEKPAPEEKPEPSAADNAVPATDATPALDARLAAKVETMSAKIKKLEEQGVALERDALFAARPDLSDELKAELANESPEKIKRVLSAIKPPTASPTAELTASSTATRGNGTPGGNTKRVLAGSPEMRSRMGLVETTSAVVHEGPVMRLGVTLPKESV